MREQKTKQKKNKNRRLSAEILRLTGMRFGNVSQLILAIVGAWQAIFAYCLPPLSPMIIIKECISRSVVFMFCFGKHRSYTHT